MNKSYLLLLLLLYACNTPFVLKDIQSHKLEFHKEKLDFQIINDQLMIRTVINEDTQWVQFDSGISSQIMFFNPVKTADKYFKKKMKLPFSYENVFYKKYTPNVSTALFTINHAIGLEMQSRKGNPCETMHENIILGQPVLMRKDNPYFASFNFSSKTISFDSTLGINKNEYIPLSTNFEKGQFFIFLTLNGVRSKFLFDTGNDGFVMIKKDVFNLQYNYVAKLKLCGQLMHSVTNSNISNVNFYDKVKFKELYKYSIDHIVIESDEILENNVGLKFIENYDWVFDLKNNLVYVKPIQSIVVNDIFNFKKFKISLLNNKPQFVFKECSNDSIILFRPIIKINDFELKDLMNCEKLTIINNMDINAITSIVYE